jgi:hypothetical protein
MPLKPPTLSCLPISFNSGTVLFCSSAMSIFTPVNIIINYES